MAKHLVSFDDLSINSIEKIFNLADSYYDKLKKKEPIDICKHKIMATLFYETSTRTRMSFESAMFRLGGKVISSADMKSTSSAVKGESLADTIRVIQNYSDIIVLRHNHDGSTLLAAENSIVPIISGGDGEHEHPTQTLCDLYAIKREKGTLKNLKVALFGDLKHGRTVHSLAYGLAKFGSEIFAIAPNGFEMPDYVIHKIQSEYGIDVTPGKSLDEPMTENVGAVYVTAEQGQSEAFSHSLKIIDALYVTRVQIERFKGQDNETWPRLVDKVNKELLKKAKAKDDMIIMHPLPRRGELSYDIDKDPRAIYFKQAEYGVPVRMALIAALLGLADFEIQLEPKSAAKNITKECINPRCITRHEENARTKYVIVNEGKHLYRCAYCDKEQTIGNAKEPKSVDVNVML